MHFAILGTLDISTSDCLTDPAHPSSTCTSIVLKAPKVRQLVGMLLLAGSEVVSTDRLIDELWGDEPPASAGTTLQTYVYAARKALTGGVGADTSRRMLVTRAPGYAMVIGEQTDVAAFRAQVAHARCLLSSGELGAAVDALDAGLALWRGNVLADVEGGDLMRAHIAVLDEARLTALELRVDTMMRLGRHRELLADLRSLVVAHPFHEWFHEQLVIALSRCGRRAEALQTVRELRLMLSEELGLEPGAAIQQLHKHVLNGSSISGDTAVA